VTICQQCGADVVAADGVCGNCGWQAPVGEQLDDDAISLGETRAADVLPAQAIDGGVSGPRLERTSQMPYYPPSPPQPAGRGTGMGTQSSTSRYCGTCGARIAAGEAFCGQCGTPVGVRNGDFGTALNLPGSAPGRYQVGSNNGWSTAEGDAPTEAFVVSPLSGYQHPSGPGGQYGRPGYDSERGAPPAAGSSRTLRIVLGVLCLAGSLVSAAAAVIIAIQPR
jgi:hypothetical protein